MKTRRDAERGGTIEECRRAHQDVAAGATSSGAPPFSQAIGPYLDREPGFSGPMCMPSSLDGHTGTIAPSSTPGNVTNTGPLRGRKMMTGAKKRLALITDNFKQLTTA